MSQLLSCLIPEHLEDDVDTSNPGTDPETTERYRSLCVKIAAPD